MKELNDERKINSELKLYLKRAIIFVVAIWIGVFISNIWLLYHKESFDGASLGDSFGVINALFSGLAFAFLIYTAFMQKEELRLQRKELEENREELKRSADAHNELVKITSVQNKMLLDQIKLTRNINIHSIHPELEILAVDLGVEGSTCIDLIVRNKSLSITEVNDFGDQKIKEDQLLVKPAIKEDLLLSPSEKIEITMSAHLNGLIIYFETDEGQSYYQELTLGVDGYQIHTPSIVM